MWLESKVWEEIKLEEDDTSCWESCIIRSVVDVVSRESGCWFCGDEGGVVRIHELAHKKAMQIK